MARRPKSKDPAVAANDLGMLLISTQRYAIGRQTYMPSWCAEAIRRHWGDISTNSKGVLLRDLRDEIKAVDEGRSGLWCGGLGAKCDNDTWRDLLAWMQTNWTGGEPR